MIAKPLKPKRCKAPGCRSLFVPRSSWAKACSPECSEVIATQVRENKARQEALADRRVTKEKLDTMKGIPKLIKEAQVAFNKFIRTRDAKEPCISCGCPPPDLSALHAGRDAGHYRSTGSASHLRFNEDNCHAQCVRCNQWGAGQVVSYRIGLQTRIGVDRLIALEHNNQVRRWTREELIEIKTKYAALARQLRKERE